jgi:hypothetical protein
MKLAQEQELVLSNGLQKFFLLLKALEKFESSASLGRKIRGRTTSVRDSNIL